MDELRRQIVDYLARQPEIEAVYLYGSFATGHVTSHSDVDIGILYPSDKPVDAWKRLQMADDLAECLGRDVDLVSLTEASPVLGMQVLRKGELLFCRNRKAVNEFFVRTINSYADLKQVRKVVEKNLGKVTVL